MFVGPPADVSLTGVSFRTDAARGGTGGSGGIAVSGGAGSGGRAGTNRGGNSAVGGPGGNGAPGIFGETGGAGGDIFSAQGGTLTVDGGLLSNGTVTGGTGAQNGEEHLRRRHHDRFRCARSRPHRRGESRHDPIECRRRRSGIRRQRSADQRNPEFGFRRQHSCQPLRGDRQRRSGRRADARRPWAGTSPPIRRSTCNSTMPRSPPHPAAGHCISPCCPRATTRASSAWRCRRRGWTTSTCR